MTRHRVVAANVEPQPVLICQGCRYAWEPPTRDWTAEHLLALVEGCPECSDWLYLAELTGLIPGLRRARP